MLRVIAALGVATISPSSRAGAVDRTCLLDGATLAGGWTVRLEHPRTCPPGDVTVRRGGRSVVLPRLLWSRFFGGDTLPTVVDGWVVWIQADGDRSLLRATRVATGATTTLSRGSFLPISARSGSLLAVAESLEPIPTDITRAIPHRFVVVDFSDPDRPTLAPSPPHAVAGAALEHLLHVRDAPGAFWFLLTARSSFHVARWRHGVTELATFAGVGDIPYVSYADVAIDPVCGTVAFAACARTPRSPTCDIVIRSVDGSAARTISLPTRVAASPLPWEGAVTRLVTLEPDRLVYEWMSLTTYAVERKTLPFAARCQP